jgi:hypothetical protein
MLAIAKIEQAYAETIVDVGEPLSSADRFRVCKDTLTDQQLIIYDQNLSIMLDTTNIPPRFSKRMFDRFAPFIGDALNHWPQCVEINSTLSPRTIQRCLEEALTAKRVYNHRSLAIDEAKWLTYSTLIGTAEINGRILIGPRDTIRTQRALVGASTPFTPATPEYEVLCNEANIRVIAQLMTANALKPRPNFFVRGTDAVLRSIIEKQYDVVFAPDEKEQTKFYIT